MKINNTQVEVPQIAVMEPNEVLPNPDLVSYYLLEKERKIYIDYEIGEDLLQVHRMIMRWNMEDKDTPVDWRKPIRIYIMSYGGSVDYMWMIIDAILTSETPVITINLGVCASAASLIFMAGKERYMMPRAKVMIHEGSAELGGDATKVIDATESYKKTLKEMKAYIVERTSIPASSLNRKKSNDWELDSKYCLENNVCTKIIENISEVL